MIYKLACSFSKDNIEDLYQVGVIGLNEAYKNYEESYNTKFSTYAYTYILGEMKKYIRENKGIKVNRELYYLSSRIDKLIELMSQKLKRIPTTDELSIELNIPEWKIIEALEIRNSIRSLDEPITTNEKTLYLSDIIPANEDNIDKLEIEEMVNSLSNKEKQIIEARYFSDKSQAETADLLGCSQAKVSREEQKILKKLKNFYKTS